MATLHINPCYEGTTGEEIFVMYHPASSNSRNLGIVICSPLGPEFIRSHRAMHKMALRLAQEGFPVVRFDYHGTGNAPGNEETLSFNSMKRDLEKATTSLRKQSGCNKVSLIGCRIGAPIVLMGSPQINPEQIILWEPILNGSQFLLERDTVQQQYQKEYGGTKDPSDEWLGFQISTDLHNDLKSLCSDILMDAKTKNILLVMQEASSINSLPKLDMVEYLSIPSASFWCKDTDIQTSLVPSASIKAISEWIKHKYD